MCTLHKVLYRSRVLDGAPSNTRTTACGRIVGESEAKQIWKEVTCAACLAWKGIKNGRSRNEKKDA